MIIDNFGTITPNPWRWYVPYLAAPIVDEAADFDIASWRPTLTTMDPEPPTMGTLEGLALDRAQEALMRAVLATRRQHDRMHQAGSLRQWPPAGSSPAPSTPGPRPTSVPVEGSAL